MMIFLIPVFNGMGRVIIADLWLAFISCCWQG